MSFETNQITDKFKRTFVRVRSATQFQALQRSMFRMGFKYTNSGRELHTITVPSYLYVDENCRMGYSHGSTQDRVAHPWNTFVETTYGSVFAASAEVKAIRKARKKDQRRRKAGWIRNTGFKPVVFGSIDIMFNNGQVTENTDSGWNWALYGEDYAIGYYKPHTKVVSQQAMVAAIVASAGGTEVATPDDGEGWITWDGEGYDYKKDRSVVGPVKIGTKVDVLYRKGHTAFNVSAPHGCYWRKDDYDMDIVAYRVCEPKPVWTNVDDITCIPTGTKRLDMDLTYDALAQPDTNPKKQYGVSSVPLDMWSDLASAYGALGLYNGQLKYGKANFANTPVEASIYIAAARRHLAAWVAGEEFDPADGVPNLGGVLANIAILLEARAAGTLIDDRMKMSGYLKERDALKAIVPGLNALHEGKTPKHYTQGE